MDSARIARSRVAGIANYFHVCENGFMNVKTATRTLDVFEAFARQARPLSLSELSRLLEIPISSCFGLVRTLENRGYMYEVRRRGGFYPTQRLFDIAQTVRANDPVLDRLQPVLAGLREATQETVVVGKLQGPRVVYLDVIQSPHQVRYVAHAGEFREPHANSAGKALLGSLTEVERDEFLHGYKLTRFTPNTLVTRKALEADLAASQERGWYANVSESVSDLIGVACPLRIEGEAYSISIAGPRERMQPLIENHARKLRKACAAL